MCLRNNDVDGAGRHLIAALDEARARQQRLLLINVLETLAELSKRRSAERAANALIAACARARRELGYRSSLLTPAPANDQSSSTDPISLDDAVAIAMRTRGARRRPSSGLASLTPTELAVTDLVIAGRTNAEIAAELVMSTATVKSHLTHVFAKMGVRNRTQLAVNVGQLRLISPPAMPNR